MNTSVSKRAQQAARVWHCGEALLVQNPRSAGWAVLSPETPGLRHSQAAGASEPRGAKGRALSWMLPSGKKPICTEPHQQALVGWTSVLRVVSQG